MIKLRKYGKPPYKITLLHGGPGAPGEMQPVAKYLSKFTSVLEPLQTKDTISGQIEELKKILYQNTTEPIILLGWSWGAWLGLIFTAKYPKYVKKLILVSSGPFEEKYAKNIMPTRLKRLSKKDRKRILDLMKIFSGKNIVLNKNLEEFGEILAKADTYNPTAGNKTGVKVQYKIYENVWAQAEKLRKNGKLLRYAENITHPVLAIHGDYDPHPYLGVKIPLTKTVTNFRFMLLKNCGHHPWLEKEAKNHFYQIIKKEINITPG